LVIATLIAQIALGDRKKTGDVTYLPTGPELDLASPGGPAAGAGGINADGILAASVSPFNLRVINRFKPLRVTGIQIVRPLTGGIFLGDGASG
jgi:hypothetical protein